MMWSCVWTASLSHVVQALRLDLAGLWVQKPWQRMVSPVYCSNWKNSQQSPRLGMVRFLCLLLHSFFQFYQFSENSLTCPGHCYACCLIATYDETRPQRLQWICYFSRLKLSYCSFQDWATPSNTGGNSSRTPFKTFLGTTLNKLSWLTTILLSSKNKEKKNQNNN